MKKEQEIAVRRKITPTASRSLSPAWSVYILRCCDGSFYTGIARDVRKRLTAHRRGRGAAYTRAHLPVKLLYMEPHPNRSSALIREAAIKKLPRVRKLQIISGVV